MTDYQERFYRSRPGSKEWVSFTIQVKETDLWVRAKRDLSEEGYERVFQHRHTVEAYIRQRPEFKEALKPLPPDPLAPAIIRDMLLAGQIAGVGPMAAVAGAIAQYVGQDLLPLSADLIIENGGDLFISSSETLTVGIFAGSSALSQRLGIEMKPTLSPIGLCTSSGTVGHSLSFGKADAVTVRASSVIAADALATAVANRVRTGKDISGALAWARSIPETLGVLIIIGDQIGLWGDLKLVSL
jgi:hypothetical protein